MIVDTTVRYSARLLQRFVDGAVHRAWRNGIDGRELYLHCAYCGAEATTLAEGTHHDFCIVNEALRFIDETKKHDVPRDIERDGGGRTSVTGDPDSDIAAVIERGGL